MNSTAPTMTSGGFEVLEIPTDSFHGNFMAPCQCGDCNPDGIIPVPAYYEYYNGCKSSGGCNKDELTSMDALLLISVFILSIILCVIIMRNYK